jgi:hypothetical protein
MINGLGNKKACSLCLLLLSCGSPGYSFWLVCPNATISLSLSLSLSFFFSLSLLIPSDMQDTERESVCSASVKKIVLAQAELLPVSVERERERERGRSLDLPDARDVGGCECPRLLILIRHQGIQRFD